MPKQVLPTFIGQFDGPWFFLSNFYPLPLEHEGLLYPSSEHAYQAAKTLDPKVKELFTYPGLTAGQAKRMGSAKSKKVVLREGWDEMRIPTMKDILTLKFNGAIMKRKLFSTFTAELVEGNWWHDPYWGVCNGMCDEGPHAPYGENHLGKILMELRQELTI